MNIAQAKEYIRNTVKLYLKKDEYGDYRIPVMRQRPVFLLGAPGIGKTAIMEQIASELGIALVTYSMTHHTRQSALGLPYIEKRQYGGEEVSVSEYTMSEIIASIYETMEKSGLNEGILFLDEINCVSETLAPSMLQFLQYKVFGRHQVPEGWVIVTAGNPPEYNRSVREFDVVTLDRLKVLEVEADYPAWKIYAVNKGLHGAVLGFLEMSKDSFYKIEMTQDGRSYVTARGWEDLSDILYLYEEEGIPAAGDLVSQYIRHPEVAKEFEAYYELYGKYRRIYQIEKLLSGNAPQEICTKAGNAQIDERISLVSILLGKVREEISSIMNRMDDLKQMGPVIKVLSDAASLSNVIEVQDNRMKAKEKAGSLTQSEKSAHRRMTAMYRQILKHASEDEAGEAAGMKAQFNQFVAGLRERAEEEKRRLHNLFEFVKSAYGEEGNEMLIVVTELTIADASARFLSSFGCEDYEKYSGMLMVSGRTDELRQEILELQF